jgi:hypothetical protein
VSCDVFSDQLVDLTHGGLDPRQRAETLEHARGCATCGARLEAERRLSEGLLDWAEADAGREATPGLEARLLRALRARRRSEVRRRRRAPAWVWPLAAAAAGLALWSALPRRVATQASPETREATFRPLFDGDLEDLDGYQVVRVELSRSALAGLGFAVGEDLEARAVSADVIMGQDGVARGIRLVR